MFKNLLETKEGKRLGIVVIIGILFIICVIIFSTLTGSTKSSDGNNVKNKKDIATSSEFETKNALVYKGTWYSDQKDGMILELKADGTYTSSAWLTKGIYKLQDNTMTFKDDKKGSKKFTLQTKYGQTVMHLKEGAKEIYLYPNKELMVQERNNQEEIDKDLKNLVNQKWSDILYQNTWVAKSDDTTFSIIFYQDKYEQVKETKDGRKEKHTFLYRIITQEVEEDKSTYHISRNTEKNDVDEVTFTISEKESTYKLASNPGTFLWVPVYEKLKSEVQLTQNGITKEDTPSNTTITTDKYGNPVTVTEKILN